MVLGRLFCLTGQNRDNCKYILKVDHEVFFGGSVVKNPPTNAGDIGSIPGLDDPTCCRATKQLSLCATAIEL